MLLVVLLTGLASAQSHWSAAPATCKAGDGLVGSPVKFVLDSDGSVGFAAGEAGTIALFCEGSSPMDDSWAPAPDWTAAEITYQDSGPKGKVIVDLVSVDEWTGAYSVENLLDSDTFSPTTGWASIAYPLQSTIDFGSCTYFVRILLARSNTKAKEKVLYVGF